LLVGFAASPPGLISVAASAAAGAYDDLLAPGVESASDKGLAGHVTALRSGRVSGGVVKVGVIGVGALVGACLCPGRRTAGTVLTRAAAIAGTANLVNLFDLRPGRAAKVALVVAITGLASPDPLAASASGAITGTVLATIHGDLDELGMLGDLGANALGAAAGLRLAMLPGRTRLAVLTVIAGLTLASERVSFSRVIESVPALRWLDQLGRS